MRTETKTRKGKKRFIKIVLVIFASIILVICGLIINNRIYYFNYNKVDIKAETLTNKEIEDVISIFAYLSDYGNGIYDGFDTETELILFNRKYEFLITNNEYKNEWIFICYNESLGKNIYKRDAENPQAFATKINNNWVGSFPTHDFYNVSIIEQVPLFMPPQMFSMDDIAYRSEVVHEMVHGLQGNRDSDRVDNLKHLNNINSNYYGNKIFNKLIIQEGKILEETINLTNINEITSKTEEFIRTRDSRRNESGMSNDEIKNEREFEWLEGMARYAEYIASDGTNSIISRNLINISEKSAINGDERYYALGMAQIILIQKLEIEDWQEKLFYNNYTPEQILREYIQSTSSVLWTTY